MKYYLLSSHIPYWKNDIVIYVENIESIKPQVGSTSKGPPLLLNIKIANYFNLNLNKTYNIEKRFYKIKVLEE